MLISPMSYRRYDIDTNLTTLDYIFWTFYCISWNLRGRLVTNTIVEVKRDNQSSSVRSEWNI
jgi:hypothetical protein